MRPVRSTILIFSLAACASSPGRSPSDGQGADADAHGLHQVRELAVGERAERVKLELAVTRREHAIQEARVVGKCYTAVASGLPPVSVAAGSGIAAAQLYEK